jgi:hypothetical protein
MKRVHVAIMRKSWNLTSKIFLGEKTIESRWYMNRYKPWGCIENGDDIYFKDSGELVKLKAKVEKVMQFESLTPFKVKQILNKYGKADGMKNKEEIDSYFQMFKDKKYCLLIFLSKPEQIEPFEINKTGFGSMAAWITIEDIEKIKRR